MRSTFGGIEISKRSLFSHQAALTTTGHNVANANTRGYSRQVVNFVAAKPLEAVGMMRSNIPGQSGQGVEFTSITRIREQFLDGQFYNENKSLGEWSIRNDTLEKIEAIINEPTDTGIRQVVENFWNSWQELSKNPDNLTARSVVKESAIALTDAFNHTAKQLNDLSSDLTDNINVKVIQINTAAQQIAELNQEIFRVEGLGNDANDLRDQRDVLLDDLSKVINVNVTETDSGYNVRMGNIQLVEGRNVVTQFTAQTLEQAYTSKDLASGEAFGMIVSRDSFVASYRNELNTMIRALATGDTEVTLPKGAVIPAGTQIGTKVYNGTIEQRTLTEPLKTTVKGFNGLHSLGYALTNGEAKQGGVFFQSKDGSNPITAENISVSPDIVNNVENIASAMRTYLDPADNKVKVVKGNNDLALLMAGLRSTKFDFSTSSDAGNVVALNGGTLDEFFRAVVGQLGVQTQEATRQMANQKILVEQVESRRQSVSGVSMDEEMANMIKFQHAYNAAARALTVQDEILDKVINGMGVVGR
ncbi:flagellar hook-associated protein FlgK [Paenibacillus ginsengarvi]|uniref:Flagellar hook-associated protein 1 n=1 Tax=Paenibacillus ginsengarvi TaxID=400777 RepID=A0A3B0C6W6_9BACL|nr:flagellar hook-associated protein FlgK [Paenibacillus ginsengarvi]RKN78876.1 flagellar hook-associated protein FlgK [Paenibacillus ginsengarvi]